MADLDRAQDERVRTVVARVPHTIDRRRWSELRALYGDTVEVDYTSLFGGSVQRQRADDLIEGWRALLSPLDATQHLLGPIEVEVTGPRAVARCHVRGYHYLKDAPGGGEWMVAGHYVFELANTSGGWTIVKMRLETFHQSGNTRLLEEAGRKA